MELPDVVIDAVGVAKGLEISRRIHPHDDVFGGAVGCPLCILLRHKPPHRC